MNEREQIMRTVNDEGSDIEMTARVVVSRAIDKSGSVERASNENEGRREPC